MKTGDAVYLLRPCGDLDTETIYYYVEMDSANMVTVVAETKELKLRHLVPSENVRPVLKEK